MSENTQIALLNDQSVDPVKVFTEGGAQTILDQIKKMVDEFVPDISTDEGRAEIKSFAYKIARTKTTLDNMGKDLTEEWRVNTKKVNEERSRISKIMEELQAKARKSLDDYEASEKSRKQAHEVALMELFDLGEIPDLSPSKNIDANLYAIGPFVDRDWQEFRMRFEGLFAQVQSGLQRKLAQSIKHEQDQAELERLREQERIRQEAEAAEQAKRDEEKRIADQKARDEQIAKEAAEKARQAAEARAKEEKDRLEQEKRDADARAKKAEDDRIAAEKKAADDAKAAEEKRIKDIADAEQRERDRVARIAADEKAAQDKRDADVAHKRKINSAAAAAVRKVLESSMFKDGEADLATASQKVIEAIIHAAIPNVTIKY